MIYYTKATTSSSCFFCKIIVTISFLYVLILYISNLEICKPIIYENNKQQTTNNKQQTTNNKQF